jgi:predicted DCC family thiol-disulfide oxidoreductase YuxK
MPPRWKIKILVDGACPFCRAEGNYLRLMDLGRGRIVVEDITSPQFDPAKCGLTFDDVMGQVHGILPNGRVVKGMEVLRRAYAAVGLGWMLAPTAWPILRPLSDACYHWVARNRIRISGRGPRCAAGRCSPAVKPSH